MRERRVLAELEQTLVSAFDRAGLGALPRPLTFMSVAGRVESAATTLLASGGHARRPLAAVKVHRSADAGARVRAEAEILGELARMPDLAPTVPVMLFAGEVAGRWSIGQTVLGGTPMRDSGTRDTALALGWLERLHHARPPRVDQGLHAEIERAIDAVRDTFPLDPREREYLGSLDVARVVACGSVLEHGDFAPHNILVGSGDVGVIDWTDGRTAGVALHDALFFATTVTALRGSTDGTYSGVLKAFARGFLDPGPYREACLGSIKRHAARVGVDPSALDALFGVFLVRVAVSEGERLRAAHERGSWSSFALQVAAAERLDPARIAEAQPWLHFLRMVAAHGAVFGA
jgi:phosphotransferase family enzyme